MGFLDNFIGKMNLSSEDGYDDEYDDDDMIDEEDEDYAATAKAPKFARKSETDEEEEEEVTAPKKRVARGNAGKVVPMHTQPSSSKQTEVCMIMPKGYEESQEIAEILLKGKTVVLNMEGMNVDAAQRIIDFTSGACFTMGGNLQKISKKIFIATPSSVELSGDFVDMLGDSVDMASLNLTV